MTGTALSGGFEESKPPRAETRESGICLYGECMSDTAVASQVAGGTTSEREQRAERESFEFSIPSDGKVRVQNKTHEDDEEHEYVVAVEDGSAEWCICPDHEFRNEKCKHMIAVEDRPAIMQAASASADEIERAREDDTESGTGDDEPEVGDERVNEFGVAEVYVGEPECPTASATGWIMDRDEMDPVDQTEQTERAHSLGVEDVAFGGRREA